MVIKIFFDFIDGTSVLLVSSISFSSPIRSVHCFVEYKKLRLCSARKNFSIYSFFSDFFLGSFAVGNIDGVQNECYSVSDC